MTPKQLRAAIAAGARTAADAPKILKAMQKYTQLTGAQRYSLIFMIGAEKDPISEAYLKVIKFLSKEAA